MKAGRLTRGLRDSDFLGFSKEDHWAIDLIDG